MHSFYPPHLYEHNRLSMPGGISLNGVPEVFAGVQPVRRRPSAIGYNWMYGYRYANSTLEDGRR
jgi:hypothetical protein